MSKSTKVTVNDLHQFSLSNEDVNLLDCVQTRPNSFHIIQNHKTFYAEISKEDFQHRVYTVKINGTEYHVNILNETDTIINAMGLHIGSSKKIDSIIAPMPGLILDLNVKPGDQVKANDSLLILEAMKMENNIIAPHDGVIKSVEVKKGLTVNKGDLLIEFE
ncbi:acetyl-CoA carboxylase biotin carboxyl carrier protein subunit [Formosa sp. 4Alg 33]|uniref:acetyl-CoA carboxylase biotin carboxyl carrier protein subunit n=1 Tax=Formosa sp. 4Alg 33 TaxID=3382189 RepID=UPI003D9C2E58